MTSRLSIALCLLSLLSTSCGGGGGNSGGGGTGPPVVTPPSVQHVVIVVFENQNYSDVIDNPPMPYLNSMAQQNSIATQFFANVHPSIGNYFMMTTGQVVSTDDNFAGTFSGDDVTQALTAAGKTWRVYGESLPVAGYVDRDQYPYIKHHNPFAYFDHVRNSSTERSKIVPFTGFATDLAANSLPSYSFLVPNNLHNGHDCPGGPTCPNSDRLVAIDTWLQSNLGPLLANSSVNNSTVLIVTFDESANDNTMGGGRIPVLFAGERIKTAFASTTTYQFPSLLRFSLKSLGVTSYPGAASNAPDMDEFLK